MSTEEGPALVPAGPLLYLPRRRELLFFRGRIAHQFFCDSCSCRCGRIPSSDLASARGLALLDAFLRQCTVNRIPKQKVLALRKSLLEVTAPAASPANRILLRSLFPRVPPALVFSDIHALFYTYSPTFANCTFPLFPCHGFFSPTLQETFKAPRTESGSLACWMEPIWAAVLCSAWPALHREGLCTQWRLFDVNILKDSKKLLSRLPFLAQDRVLLAINSIANQI